MSERVAVVTCEGLDVDPDSPLLLEALANAGVEAELVVWDDPDVDWDAFALSVIRSTWDYVARVDEFRRWARSVPRLLNSFGAVDFSLDKHYLAELARRGVPVVETSFVDVGQRPAWPEGDFVVKPAVGAGSMGAERYGPGEHAAAARHVAAIHAEGRDALVQPYVASVDDRGESALVFIDGSMSHSLIKGAMLNVTESDRTNLYRKENMRVRAVDERALAVANAVLAAAGFDDLLYARVDLVETESGWALMELELVEPSLFFYLVPTAAPTLARAITARLDPRRPR